MSIEKDGFEAVEINAETDVNAILSQVCERETPPVVTLNASVENWERVKTFLFASRAMNVSPLLLLNKPEQLLEDEEIQYLFGFLRDWDQLVLQNFLALCEEWVPKDYQQALKTEAKMELKWVKEWLTASADPRINKYPSLPWRSFLRKIVSENHDFAVRFLELAAAPATDENVAKMLQHVKDFLEAKKKVLCVFPKRWSKSSDKPIGIQEH